jgi:hypothetical protein
VRFIAGASRVFRQENAGPLAGRLEVCGCRLCRRTEGQQPHGKGLVSCGAGAVRQQGATGRLDPIWLTDTGCLDPVRTDRHRAPGPHSDRQTQGAWTPFGQTDTGRLEPIWTDGHRGTALFPVMAFVSRGPPAHHEAPSARSHSSLCLLPAAPWAPAHARTRPTTVSFPFD